MLENTIPQAKPQLRCASRSVDKLLESLCQQHQISTDQLIGYFNDPSKFDAKKWQEMQAFRQKLEAELTCLLENVSDPFETKNKYKELEHARRWIPVR